MPRGQKSSPPEKFVRAYVTEASIADVARKLGITEGAVHQRVKVLARAGVILPKKARGRKKPRPLDVAALNALIASLTTTPISEPEEKDHAERP